MKTILLPLVFFLMLSVNAQQKAGLCLLKSGFEAGVSISEDRMYLQGSDTGIGSWEKPGGWVDYSDFFYAVGKDKNIRDYMDSAIEDRIGADGKVTRVLRMTNIADDSDREGTSRNEFSFFGKAEPDDYKEGYVKYQMKLQANLNQLVPFEKEASWYMIMEWKEPNSQIVKTAEECKNCCNASKGGTNNYRINVGLMKEASSNQLFWVVRGEHPQPCRVEEWRYINREVEVPLGEWFTVEAYMKKHFTDGHVYFAINGSVVLDTKTTKVHGFTGRTTHPEHPMVFQFWSPLKNYHGMEWNTNGAVSQWYDNFELWTSFPPGHPVLEK